MSNRLAQSQSLYLRKHAENPIDWWSWSDEALARAKADNKPIFLSIGYSSCHWCTVMEGEAFSDSTIAEYMNANFLPIKVDREERPDIDSIYMQALQMLTGQGGWPLNVFLSPDDLVPFYGGTYFPIEPRYGRPGFLQLLQALRRYYDTEQGKVRALKEEILGYLQQAAVLETDDGRQEFNQDLLRQGWETNTGVISGGNYGGGPSFPMIPYAGIALQGTRFKFASKYDSEQACLQRGSDLALGGIYDHIAGGFHRYTVDPTWTVPHFEKMLYDNGQIVEYLANLWSAGVQEPAFERAITGTVEWLKREMIASEGYFWAAQDADSFANLSEAEPEEGAFYVWSYDQLARLLAPEELGELQQQFTVTVEGNFEGNNVLQRRHTGSLSDTLEAALLKLFQARYGATASALETFPPARNNQEAKTGNWPGRIPPVTDTKMIVAWNSLMISGLARASAVFKKPEYLFLAGKSAKFILDNQFVDGRFYRLNYEGKPAVLAQSEDYALFIKGLLDLHQASLGLGTGDKGDKGIIAKQRDLAGRGGFDRDSQSSQLPIPNFWLEKTLRVQEEFDDYLWSVELSGYYNTASDASSDLLVRERSYADNASPAANGVAIANLVKLAILTEDLQYLDRAEQALRAFSGVMQRSPQACPSLFVALDWYLHCTLVRTTDSQIAALANQYLPTTIFALETSLPSDCVGLVCQGLSCLEPASSVEQMLEQVNRSQVRS